MTKHIGPCQFCGHDKQVRDPVEVRKSLGATIFCLLGTVPYYVTGNDLAGVFALVLGIIGVFAAMAFVFEAAKPRAQEGNERQ